VEKSCYKKIYKTSTVVVISKPIECFGYEPIDQPRCEFLEKCLDDNGFKLDKAGRVRKKANGNL